MISDFIVFGSFVHVLVAVFDQSEKQAGLFIAKLDRPQ
jgi:hypothetical protein